eukprot:scaffold276180_cov19-Tisochrysis_lutea.AAC.3
MEFLCSTIHKPIDSYIQAIVYTQRLTVALIVVGTGDTILHDSQAHRPIDTDLQRFQDVMGTGVLVLCNPAAQASHGIIGGTVLRGVLWWSSHGLWWVGVLRAINCIPLTLAQKQSTAVTLLINST